MQSLEQWMTARPAIGANDGLGQVHDERKAGYFYPREIEAMRGKLEADLGTRVAFKEAPGIIYEPTETRRTGDFIIGGEAFTVEDVFQMSSDIFASLRGFPMKFDQSFQTGVGSQGRWEWQEPWNANRKPFGWRPDKIPVVPSGPGPDVPPYPPPAGKMWTKGLMGWGLADAVDVPAQIGWSVQDRTDLRELLRIVRDARAAGRL